MRRSSSHQVMSNPGRAFKERAAADPTAVTPSILRETIRAVSPKEVPHVLTGISITIETEPTLPEEFVAMLCEEVSTGDRETRLAAMRGLSTIAAVDPEPVISELPTVLNRLEDPFPPVRAAALRCLLAVGEADPDAILPYLDDVVRLVDDPVPYVGEVALGFLRQLHEEHAEEIVPALDAIVAILVDPPRFEPKQRLRWHAQHPDYEAHVEREGGTSAHREDFLALAAYLLAQLAPEFPGEFVDHVPALAEVIDREGSYSVRYHLLDTIRVVAEHDPDAAGGATGVIAAVLAETHDDELRERAAWVLTWLAEGGVTELAETVPDTLPPIERMLETDRTESQAAAASLLSYIGQHDPSQVEPSLPRLRELLEAEDPQIRGLSVWALAYAGTEDDRERLEIRAREDSTEEVRRAAEEATAILADHVEG